MGWGTQFTADMYISREHFDSKSEVEDEIIDTKEKKQEVKEQILMHGIAGVAAAKKIDDNKVTLDAVDYIHGQLVHLLDEYEHYTNRIYALNLLKENFDKSEKV